MYIPTLMILEKIIKKKNQRKTNYYTFFIGIRHHKDYNFLLDQIINILLSHMDNLIYISVSLSRELFDIIPKELKAIASYISFSHHILNPSGPGSYMQLTNSLIDHRDINYDYYIYHTSTEYYIRPFFLENDIIYEKRKTSPSDEQLYNSVINFRDGNWKWGKSIVECERTMEFFKNNRLIMSIFQMSGIVIPKNIMDDFMNFTDKSRLNLLHENFQSKMLVEVLLSSFIRTRWKLISEPNDLMTNSIMSITNCFWGKQSYAENLFKNDIKENKVNYFCVKKCDCGAPLLKLSHMIYMEPMLREYNIKYRTISDNIY